MTDKKYEPFKAQCRICKFGHIHMAKWDEWLEQRDALRCDDKTAEQAGLIEPVLPYEKKVTWWQKDGPCSDLPFWAMPENEKSRFMPTGVTYVDCSAYEHIESTRWESINVD